MLQGESGSRSRAVAIPARLIYFETAMQPQEFRLPREGEYVITMARPARWPSADDYCRARDARVRTCSMEIFSPSGVSASYLPREAAISMATAGQHYFATMPSGSVAFPRDSP